jgi:hypothetical protein
VGYTLVGFWWYQHNRYLRAKWDYDSFGDTYGSTSIRRKMQEIIWAEQKLPEELLAEGKEITNRALEYFADDNAYGVTNAWKVMNALKEGQSKRTKTVHMFEAERDPLLKRGAQLAMDFEERTRQIERRMGRELER